MGLGVKNLTRSKIGRAFSAIRDRDIAAEALGINLFKFKMYAFAVRWSSFFNAEDHKCALGRLKNDADNFLP